MASPASTHAIRFAVGPHWFLTGPASAEDLTSGEPRIPDLVTHAKSMGTNTSACGLTTTTWAKLWDTPFEAAPLARRCPLCVTHVALEDRPAPGVGSVRPVSRTGVLTVDRAGTSVIHEHPSVAAQHLRSHASVALGLTGPGVWRGSPRMGSPGPAVPGTGRDSPGSARSFPCSGAGKHAVRGGSGRHRWSRAPGMDPRSQLAP